MSLNPRHIRILQVEDDREYRRLTKWKLEASGLNYTLYQAHMACEGVAFLSGNEVDVVLLDLNLPDAFGGAALAMLQEVAPTTPVVVLTAEGETKTAVTMLSRGAAAFVQKMTLGPQGLKRVIEDALALGCTLRCVPLVQGASGRGCSE